MNAPIKKIAVFASGAGSNAARIVARFENSGTAQVALIVTNKPDSGVVEIAKDHNVPVLYLGKEQFSNGDGYAKFLLEQGIDFIVLAGFLWKIPVSLVNSFPQRIINIHPALLPAYGGKGMYGKHVHQAVLDNKEAETGITIHWVDEVYDHGAIIFQSRCNVMAGDDVNSLSKRVAQLEHEHYPAVIERLITTIDPL